LAALRVLAAGLTPKSPLLLGLRDPIFVHSARIRSKKKT